MPRQTNSLLGMPRLRELTLVDRPRAAREIASLTASLPEAVADQLDLLIATSPAPEQGLHYTATFLDRHPAVMRRLSETPGTLRYLVGVFTYSQFLSEGILDHPGWTAQLLDPEDLDRLISHEDLRRRLMRALPPGVPDPVHLARFRRRQLLRIVTRDIFGMGTLPEITGELTALADVMVETAYERIHAALARRYGQPRTADGKQAHFTVMALGKMGAEELNYSSDIDLMFLYSDNGETDGENTLGDRISNREFFIHAAGQLTSLLSAHTAEGLCYRVDLRLRPDGKQGEVCTSWEGAKHYYENRARDWELQMLIKARIAAGYRPTGRRLLAFVAPKTYSTSLDFSTIEQLSLTRERLSENLAEKRSRQRKSGARDATPVAIDVKLDRGGIRDIEFLVQCLQRLQGGTDPWLQHRSTVLALARLHDKGVLADTDYGRLASAYQFLRTLEHRLQFDEDLQTHTLPTDPKQLEILAKRMSADSSPEWLHSELQKHFDSVTAIYDRVVHLGNADEANLENREGLQSATLLTTLDMRAPLLAAAVAGAELDRGAARFEHFLELLASSNPRGIVQLSADAELTDAALDLFEHSGFLADDLVRQPSNIFELTKPLSSLLAEPNPAPDAAALRRWYRRGILRIEAESLCRSQPIFDTLDSHSELVEAVIRHAYRIVVSGMEAQGSAVAPASEDDDINVAPLRIVALGRLGMREFDVGSDADLTFVLADSAGADIEYWTRVAARIVSLVGAYTGEGTLFAVDTRLRPNGSAGPLVQTERTYLEYFTQKAEAWESITYLKARVVAGHASAADAFLQRLQQVYWNRYGETGSSRTDLRSMRSRLEIETGDARPLKAGRGGYYDIDFLLMYLRLKSAGVYYRALNTLTRIEVLETLQKLSRADAAFLRDVGTFYRAVDHGVRLISGHAEGRLPKSTAMRDALNAVLSRWTSIPLSDLDQVKAATRALFERYFG